MGFLTKNPAVGPSRAARMKELEDRVGVCCSCCHRLPRFLHGLLAKLGRFPYHPTWNQFLTPEVAEGYQSFGFAVASVHQDVLNAGFQLLEDGLGVETHPPWFRQ